MKRIIVIGGGMAGASAAHSLMQRGYTVTILEQSDRLGGRVHSELVNGAAVEMGAGFMTEDYTNMQAFLMTAGLDSQLHRQHSSSGFYRGGSIVPVTPGTLASTQLLSSGAKVRGMSFLPEVLATWPQLSAHAFWRAVKYDRRSVSAMFSGRSGKEFLEYMLQPILDGYFYWTPEHTSEAMMLLVCKLFLLHKTYKMQGGLQRIAETAAKRATILLGHTVQTVRRQKDKTYTVIAAHGGKPKTLQADGIVCATTASAVPAIFDGLTKQQKSFFQAVQYSSTALIARTYKHEQTLGNKSIAFPRQEGIALSAVTLAREPGGTGNLATLKTYASGTIGKQLCQESDKAVVRTLTGLMEPAREAMLIGDPEPIATHVQKWPEALPFFDVGHFKRLRSFANGEIEDPDQAIVFAGDYLGGPFMEGAFTSGMEAAERLVSRLQAEN